MILFNVVLNFLCLLDCTVSNDLIVTFLHFKHIFSIFERIIFIRQQNSDFTLPFSFFPDDLI